MNPHRENIEGSPDGDASRAHQRVRTWSLAHDAVVTGRRSSAHCSVRQCPLENPPVGTGESAGAHWRANAQGDLQCMTTWFSSPIFSLNLSAAIPLLAGFALFYGRLVDSPFSPMW